MNVNCDIEWAQLEGDYGPVDGTIATCGRCGHQTESFGTHQGSVNRCLVMLRNECPRHEHNFYVDRDSEEPKQRQRTGSRRREAPPKTDHDKDAKRAYDLGYKAGYDAGRAAAAYSNGSGNLDLNADQVKALIRLCHPDVHPPERYVLANKATAKLLAILERLRAH